MLQPAKVLHLRGPLRRLLVLVLLFNILVGLTMAALPAALHGALAGACAAPGGGAPPLGLALLLLRLGCEPARVTAAPGGARALRRRVRLALVAAPPRQRACLERELASAGLARLCEESDSDREGEGAAAAGGGPGPARKRARAAGSECPPRHLCVELLAASGRARRRARQLRGAGPAPVEERVPLSQSALWRELARYYATRGLGAWQSSEVPYAISSSCFAAAWYADAVAAFCQSLPPMAPAAGSAARRCVVLDLGSGHGGFALRLATRLLAMQREGTWPAPGLRPVVVATDFHDEVLRRMMAHPRFARLVAVGALDWAVLDLARLAGEAPAAPGERHAPALTLGGSGQVLDLFASPVVAVANYVLDSLGPDVLRRSGDGRELELAVVTTWPRRVGPGAAAPSAVNADALELDFEPAPSALEERLRGLRLDGSPGNQIALVPTTAALALGRLLGLGEQRCSRPPRLLVVGDKMVDSRQDAQAWAAGLPGLEAHGPRCVSCCVDPHVLAQVLPEPPAAAWHSGERPGQQFGVSVYHFGAGHGGAAYSDDDVREQALRARLARLCESPSVSDYDGLRGWLEQDRAARVRLLRALDPASLAALVALSQYDSEFFHLLKWTPGAAGAAARSELVRRAALACHDNRLPGQLLHASESRADKPRKPRFNQKLDLARWLLVHGHAQCAAEVARSVPRGLDRALGAAADKVVLRALQAAAQE